MKLSLLPFLFLPTLLFAQNEWKNVYSERAWVQRDTWQRPDEILQFLALKDNSTVADIGAHEGYFTMKLARAVPEGIVYAVEISSTRIERLEKIAREQDLGNVTAILGKADDPTLPENSLDAVLIVDTYHEIKAYQEFLRNLKRAMKKNARLVLCEPIAMERREQTREIQFKKHELDLTFALDDLREAGFEILHHQENFVDRTQEKGDHMWIILARKKP
jgi:cyclopropane fatty-acyl-phospholipid synthase-like methyltransferase